jgi:predicted unusual protein kinase regulating ubiquinone biosynthesis (AarF/ABC1/UbiB family)
MKEQTIDELMEELAELRQRIIELKALGAEHRHLEERRGMRIGEILVKMDYVTESQLGTYLRKQKAEMLSYLLDYEQRRIGEMLVESGIITEEQLQKGLAEQQKTQ